MDNWMAAGVYVVCIVMFTMILQISHVMKGKNHVIGQFHF